MMEVKRSLVIVALLALIAFAYTVAWQNYRECREAGFGGRYCATTNLVR